MRWQAHNLGRAGFTLVEILVTIFLIFVLGALVGYPLVTGLALVEKGLARADALTAARLATDAMTRELAEAMYVFDLPSNGEFVAFLLPRSPQAATPPLAPQTTAVRYWRALRDPALASWHFWEFDPANPTKPHNPYYLARTEVSADKDENGNYSPPQPQWAYTQDAWNYSPLLKPSEPSLGRTVPRVIFWYDDGHSYGGSPWPTAQPGYPWLEAVTLYPLLSPLDTNKSARYQWYRERAVGLTPDDPNYDLPVAEFSPERITAEAMVAWTGAFPRDYSRYRARYPLWQGFAQWEPVSAKFLSTGRVEVYAGSDRTLPRYRTSLDVSTGHVWVQRVSGSTMLYDVGAYPRRDVTYAGDQEFAFGIDYDRGDVRFDFPAEDAVTVTADNAGANIYDLSREDWGLPTPPATPPTLSQVLDLDADATRDSRKLIGGSVAVWVETPTGDVVYYKPVEPAPGNPAEIGSNHFVVSGLQIIFDADAGDRPGEGDVIHISYRYRNNTDDQLVVATYGTKAVINVKLTVSKRDAAALSPAKSRQDASLAVRIKVKNVPR